MSKIYFIPAIATGLYVIIMLLMIIHPLDFADKDVEKIYNENEGLIWFIGIGLATGIGIMTFMNGIFQSELKEWALINKEKNATIIIQNERLIGNQEEYIKEIRFLNRHINENSEKDIKTLALLQQQVSAIEDINRRVKRNEVKIMKLTAIDERLLSIERLLKIHDNEIETLKKA